MSMLQNAAAKIISISSRTMQWSKLNISAGHFVEVETRVFIYFSAFALLMSNDDRVIK